MRRKYDARAQNWVIQPFTKAYTVSFTHSSYLSNRTYSCLGKCGEKFEWQRPREYNENFYRYIEYSLYAILFSEYSQYPWSSKTNANIRRHFEPNILNTREYSVNYSPNNETLTSDSFTYSVFIQNAEHRFEAWAW